jgi:hypothetical protein
MEAGGAFKRKSGDRLDGTLTDADNIFTDFSFHAVF